jgi:hypothetical protein
MSGTTTNTTKNYDAEIFTGERSEFGMLVFSDPHRQATYEHHETKYKKTYEVKHAYDKQEFLRKMRADIKREYLTRKKQVKRLQRDAAVEFRNAEMSLQEHYASASAQGYEPWRIHGVDINAPLVSQIQLPSGETLDLKTLQCDTEFAKVFGIHEDLRLDQIESIRIHEEEQQRQREYEATNEASWNQWTRQQYHQRSAYEHRGAFGGCYDDNGDNENDANGHWECHDAANCSTCGHDDDDDSYVGEEQQQQQQQPQQQQQEEEPQGRYGDGGYCGCGDLECSDCFSYDNENEDRDSYDSDYCAEFGYYPREYNYEREIREAEEARAAAAAAEQQRWEENTRDSDGETWDEEAIADEAEHRREVAQMKLDGDMTYTCDDYPDVQQLEHIQVTEPKERFAASAASTGGMISAQKKAAAGAAAKAAKARQAKQQQKKHEKKFAPLQVIDNTNRSNEVTAILTANKLEINLPKKNLQNVSREGKRRHVAIWRRIETAEKHASARGTRIANIPEPMSWHNCGGSDNDNDYDY